MQAITLQLQTNVGIWQNSHYSHYTTGCMVWASNPNSSKMFSSPSKRPQQLRNSFSLIFNGYEGPFPGIKQPPSSSETKEEWSYKSALPLCLKGMKEGQHDPLAAFPNAFLASYRTLSSITLPRDKRE